MNTYIVEISLTNTAKYDGSFEFSNLEAAVEKVNSNIDTGCTTVDAQNGLDIYGAAHYFDRLGEGTCVIRKESK